MLLKDLIFDVDDEFEDLQITGITSDSREIKDGYAFVCIKGVNDDGHKYAEIAAEKGAWGHIRLETGTCQWCHRYI